MDSLFKDELIGKHHSIGEKATIQLDNKRRFRCIHKIYTYNTSRSEELY